MDNFNPISLVRDVANGLIHSRRSQNPSSNLNPLSSGSESSAPAPKPQVAYTSVRTSPLEAPRLQELNFEQKANSIKDLLELPRELKDFLNELSKLSTQTQGAQGKDATGNLIKMALVGEILGKNAEAAMQKLVQIISNAARAGVCDLGQLKEMLGIIGNSLSVAGGADNAQTVKNLLLLYLPWLPLNEKKTEYPIDFDLDFFDDKDSNEAQDKSEEVETVGILIQTQVYGNISSTLEAKKGADITILMNAPELFPHGMFKKLFLERSKAEGIGADIITQDTKQVQGEKRDTPSVKMTTQSTISPQLLLASYTLIRLVIEIDKDALVQK